MKDKTPAKKATSSTLDLNDDEFISSPREAIRVFRQAFAAGLRGDDDSPNKEPKSVLKRTNESGLFATGLVEFLVDHPSSCSVSGLSVANLKLLIKNEHIYDYGEVYFDNGKFICRSSGLSTTVQTVNRKLKLKRNGTLRNN